MHLRMVNHNAISTKHLCNCWKTTRRKDTSTFYSLSVKEFISPAFHLLLITIIGREKSRSQSSTFWHIWEKQFSFSYAKVEHLIKLIEASNEIERVSKFDNSLSFGTKQNALRPIFFELWIFKDFFMKNFNWIFFDFLWFCVGSIKECIYVCLGMQIQENMFMNIAAHLWGCFWAF